MKKTFLSIFVMRHYLVGFLWTTPSKVKEALTSSLQTMNQELVRAVGRARSWGRQHQGPLSIQIPLALPYDVMDQHSIAYLVQRAASHVKRSEERPWVNPYHDFIELNKEIWRHFRDLAEKVDLGQSYLLWHITQTIEHIARVHLYLLKEPLTEDPDHVRELVSQLSWYLSFFWAACCKAAAIDVSYAEHASGTLGWIGLAFYDAGYLKIVETCADNTISVASDCFKISGDPSPYQVADLLMPIWYMKMLAEVKEDEAIVHMLDSKLIKPQEMVGEGSTEIMQALQKRQVQLQEELSAYDSEYRVMFNESKRLLKQLIEKHQRSNGESSSTSQPF